MKNYSRQREEILTYLKDSYSHPDAEEVYQSVKQKAPNISRGTVYRNLALLVEEKDIIKIPVQNGADRYDYMKTKHHHVICKICGNVADFDYKLDMNNLKNIIRKQTNMELFSDEILVHGICEKCKKVNL